MLLRLETSIRWEQDLFLWLHKMLRCAGTLDLREHTQALFARTHDLRGRTLNLCEHTLNLCEHTQILWPGTLN
jgi:hypothetical protein